MLIASQYSQDPKIERSLRHSVRDGMAWSVMFGAGESYLQAFAVFLKASTTQVALLAALPSFLGSLSQLFSAWVAGHSTRRKPLILGSALLQAMMWIPLAALAFMPSEHTITLLIVAVALYYVAGQFASPLWSSLISDLVPERWRGRFFGSRTRLMSMTTFLSMGAAGILLEFCEQRAFAQWGFALLFAVALLARLYSIMELSMMHEPPRRLAPLTLPPLKGLYRRIAGSNFSRFILFVGFLNFSVAIASPFFTLYMLRDLGFSYLELTAVNAFYVLVQFSALKMWGRLSDIFGNRLILHITSMMFPVLPILWLLLPNFWCILGIQMISGLCWAGFSLASGNFLYDVTTPEKRAAYSAIHQTLSNSAIFCGALIGGFLGMHAPADLFAAGNTISFTSGLWAVMIASSVARLIVTAIFLPRL
ncbi:MAG TPA: MFS transporter, partial [Burkholderiales bacterium]|nr:MFS transporter [Burkholderiales bacterium]